MSDKNRKVQMPEVGSEWDDRASDCRATVLPPDMDNPRGPTVVYRFEDGVIDSLTVAEFHRAFDPAPPPMPTVADRWYVVNRAGELPLSYTAEDGADAFARRNGLLVAHMVCVEVREPRPAGGGH